MVCEDPKLFDVLASSLSDYVVQDQAPLGFVLKAPSAEQKLRVLLDRSGLVFGTHTRMVKISLGILTSHLAALLVPPEGTDTLRMRALVDDRGHAILAMAPLLRIHPVIERRLARTGHASSGSARHRREHRRHCSSAATHVGSIHCKAPSHGTPQRTQRPNDDCVSDHPAGADSDTVDRAADPTDSRPRPFRDRVLPSVLTHQSGWLNVPRHRSIPTTQKSSTRPSAVAPPHSSYPIPVGSVRQFSSADLPTLGPYSLSASERDAAHLQEPETELR